MSETTKNRYSAFVLVIFNTIILLILINLALYFFFKTRDAYFKPNPIIQKYGIERIKKVYPNKNETEIKTLLDESWHRPMAYDTYTGFKEREWTSVYVNVDHYGFRNIKDQQTWPPKSERTSVFVFGGSTTFGYGLADNETIPSHLQSILREYGLAQVDIYNFGQGRYFLGQERALFEKLISQNHIPDLAIFIDGLNEYHPDGEPYGGEYTADVLDGKISGLIIPKIPMGRLMISLRQRLAAKFPKSSGREIASTTAADELYGNTETVDAILTNYERNKKMIEAVSDKFGIKPVFVWQPVPLYNYNISAHLFGAETAANNDTHQYSKYTYPPMAKLLAKGNFGRNFLWLADMQANSAEPLYVDQVHYTDAMSRSIAKALADFLISRDYLKANQ